MSQALKVKTAFCSSKHITDGTIGIMTLLIGILSEEAFRYAGEEKTMEAFIRATSPDRLDNPRKGSELWDYLKETFPLGEREGIDKEVIIEKMSDILLADFSKL